LTRFRLVLAMVALGSALPVSAQSAERSGGAEIAWRLLDYIAVDYPEAVRNGRVVNDAEYAEMKEFAGSVHGRIEALPARPARASLLQQTKQLQSAIDSKAAPAEIEKVARSLGSALLAAYPVPLAPPSMPDVARGAPLFAQNCAACHGAKGDANAPIAASMDPPPIDFTDRDRARERSVFALYQVIDQGLEGTAMQSFSKLPSEDKWALAFQAGRYAFQPELAAEGRRIWESDPALRQRIPDLAALVAVTPAALASEIGPEKAAAVTAYLRGNPVAVAGQAGLETLAIARDKLRQSLQAYNSGDREQAKNLALSAYLDGFEPVEPLLAARNAALMARVESAMAELRAAISAGRDPSEVADRIAALDSLFVEVETALAPDKASTVSAFLGAFTILLREGLEALLIVVGMLAFLRKADRRDMVRPVHGGWIAALVAGLATWWAASNVISISGASRELTEGFGSALAALVLLFVGVWMHRKSQANEWQRYLREKVGRALSKSSAWFLFFLAFIAVYREVFETILFFAAISAQGQTGALVGGAVAGLVVLAVIALAMLRFSRKLPIGKFFAYSSALIAVLAVVLTGKAVAALQEAGLLGITPLGGAPRIEILGLYPTVEGIAAQALMLAALLAGFAVNRREARRLAVA
ncbi:MAG TPA: cytochrome c/FTR1 family iron permease, partial [Sphingomicrobium sp.]|nr:cytochrome c/FTR1 family iron permease [Sphingomicrobium sp.]